MSVLSVLGRTLGGAAKVAGAGLEGYGLDQRDRAKRASDDALRVLAEQKAAQDAESSNVLNTFRRKQTEMLGQSKGPKIVGHLIDRDGNAYNQYDDGNLVKATIQDAPAPKGLTAPTVAQAPTVSTPAPALGGPAQAPTAPPARAVAAPKPVTPAAPRFGPRPPATPTPALHEVTLPDGSKVLRPASADLVTSPPRIAEVKPLAAPMAAKVGQFGEMLKKADDLFRISQGMDVSVGASATRDLAEHGVHIPFIGTIPGSKGLGSAMLGHSPEYAQYQAALSPFILAAAHALSGARINQDQVEQIRKSIEVAPGDFTNKNVRDQKAKNLIDLINSIGGALPAEAITDQEGQMNAEALTRLTTAGYQRRVAPSKTGKTLTPAQYAKVRQHYSDAELRAQGYSIP